jgi:hypothetical protein
VPRGFPADSPRGTWLRWKGVEVNQRPAAHDGASGTQVGELLAVGDPLHGWLADHVGPSALSAEERFAPKRSART